MNGRGTGRAFICIEWRENFRQFSDEHEFPHDAREMLADTLEKIGHNDRLYTIFRSWEIKYWENPSMDYDGLFLELEKAGNEEGISHYTLNLLFFIGISRRTWELYQRKGISREIFHDSMADIRWKLLECHKMYGIWGTFVGAWFPWWFELKRFALGRLQFELIPFEDEYERDGMVLHKDTMVLNVHIPSSGALKPQDVKASYEKAAVFYEKEFRGRALVFMCISWLLFQPHREILPKGSNIRAFMEDYDVFRTVETNEDLWRIFYGAEKGDLEKLPENTGLERTYKRWLLSGHKAGYSAGVYVYS